MKTKKPKNTGLSIRIAELAAIAMIALPFVGESNAFAQNDKGNGGGAFICDDPTKSEFLDLFEASLNEEGNLGLNIIKSKDSVSNQIQNAFLRFDPKTPLYRKIIKTYQKVLSAKRIPIPANMALSWPIDEKNRYQPINCKERGIIIYHDSSQQDSMDIDNNSLKLLSKTDQAAAWVHETIYKYLRDTQGDIDSIRTRKIVGYLFSNLPDSEVRLALEKYGIRPQDCAMSTSLDEVESFTVKLNSSIEGVQVESSSEDYFVNNNVLIEDTIWNKIKTHIPLSFISIRKTSPDHVLKPFKCTASFDHIQKKHQGDSLGIANYNSFNILFSSSCPLEKINVRAPGKLNSGKYVNIDGFLMNDDFAKRPLGMIQKSLGKNFAVSGKCIAKQ